MQLGNSDKMQWIHEALTLFTVIDKLRFNNMYYKINMLGWSGMLSSIEKCEVLINTALCNENETAVSPGASGAPRVATTTVLPLDG